MVPMRLAFLCALLAVAGCTHTRTFDPAREGDRLIVNDRVRGERVTVRLASGQRERAEALRIEADSMTWVDPATRAVYGVPTGEVIAVESGRRAGRGAGDGARVGALTGALLGLSLVFTAPEEDEDLADALAPFFVISGAASGALYGVIIGALVGSRDVYRFEAAPTAAPETGD